MMKYGKYCPLPIFHNTFQALLLFIHAQHAWSANTYHHEIRVKCVNMAYRLMEAAQGTVGFTLLPYVEQRVPGKNQFLFCVFCVCLLYKSFFQ